MKMACHLMVTVVLFVVISIANGLLTLSPGHPLHTALHYVESLHKDQISSTKLDDGNFRQIEFTTHGRYFRLHLRRSADGLHPNFHRRSNHAIRYDQFYSGRIAGEYGSHVIAHVTDEGVVTAIIRTPQESYYIEPSHPHIKESHDYHMITYKNSDVKYNMTGKSDNHLSYCHGGIDLSYHFHGHFTFNNNNNNNNNNLRYSETARLRRQAPPITVCPMHLEATRSFYLQFGGSPPRSETAINYLLFLMKAVNDIFINTNFFIPGVLDSASPGSKGLEVASITVVTDQNSGASYHQDLNRNSEELLREFSVADWSKYCLSHLFIANSFSDSARLGVAYIANAQSFISGGICSRRTRLGNLDFYGNTGLSTFRGQSRLLLIAESVIVTAHEIGHNWGSAHDDTSVAECNPSQDNGGKFLMYPVAQDGSSTNNILFSNCSIRGISRVLSTHESDCFVEPQDDLCGNYVVDPDESCDPGPSGVQNNGDDCCYGNCTLRNGNRCSDANHDCCANCQLKPLHTICRQVEENNSLCIDNTVCNGVDITCPNENRYVSNGTNCGLMGRCVDVDNTNEINKTQCINFCELQNLVTCHCTGSDQCKICCLDENNNCKVYELEDTINLPEGSFCEGGTCNTNGECVFAEADLVNYIFDLLSGFNRDDIGRFISENIVLFVVVVSLIFWIPGSVFIHVFDLWWEEKQKDSQKKTEKDSSKVKEDKVPLTEDVDSDVPLLSDTEKLDPEKDNIRLHVYSDIQGQSLA